MKVSRPLLLPCLCLAPVCVTAHADEPTTWQDSWPQKVVVNVGDIRTRIDGPKMWTLSGIDYQGAMGATEDSAYGTVLTIRNVGHLGTAHFLDAPDKPGGVEKEDVRSLQFFVNGKRVKELRPRMELSGKTFRMERTSNIRDLNLHSTVLIRDNMLIETAHFHVTKPMDLQKAHPLMYAWTPDAKFYLFGDDKGVLKRGTFRKEGETTWETIKDCRWVALFNPATGKGSVCYITKHPSSPEPWFMLIDAPGIYRKVAMYTLVDKIVPAGFDGTYQAASGFFSATEKNWETKALERLQSLKKLGDKSVQSHAG